MKEKIMKHKEACSLLNVNPEKVRVVERDEFREITGRGVGRNYGICSTKYKVYWVKKGCPLETYVHELLHIIYPKTTHWRIYMMTYSICGEKPAREYIYIGRGKYTCSERITEIPDRDKLLKLVKAQSKRMGLD